MLPFKVLDSVPHDRVNLSPSKKGSLSELKLCCYFIELGYEVFRNVNPDGLVDIIVVDRETMTTHYIDGKTPQIYRGKLNLTIKMLTPEQRKKGVKVMVYYEEKIYYVDKNNHNYKEFIIR